MGSTRRKVSGRRLLFLAALTLVLLAVARLTTFENQIAVEVTPDAVRLYSHEDMVEVPLRVAAVRQVSVRLQSSMNGGVRLASYALSGPAGPISALRFDCFYLFGHCLFGSTLYETASGFRLSFGDWTMDRVVGPPVRLGLLPFASPARLTLTFLGRGSRDVLLELGDDRVVKASVNDGLIDNSYALCVDDRCLRHGYSREPIATNLRRIANWLAEALLLGALLWWAAALLGGLRLPRPPVRTPRGSTRVLALAVLVGLAHLAAASWFARDVLGSTPHISDSAIYYRQAILLSRGTLTTAPLPAEPWSAFQSNGSRIVDGRLEYVHAGHFWPALLGLFIRLGAPDALGPLLSAFAVLLVFLLGRLLFDDTVAIGAAVLLAMCPFMLIQAGDYMSHTPTLAFLLTGIVATAYGARSRRAALLAAGGACVAYAFGMRPLTVAAVCLPWAIYVALHLRPYLHPRTVLAFAAGAAAVGALVLGENYLMSGSWFTFPHQSVQGRTVSIANLPDGLNAVDAILGYLPAAVVGSSVPVLVLGLFTFPLFVSFDARTRLLVACFLVLAAAHVVWGYSGLHGYGPRFLFESLFALALLAAYSLSTLLGGSSALTRVAVLVLVLVGVAQNAYMLADVLPRYRDYNGIALDAVRELRRHAERRAIFVMPGGVWQQMDVATTLFDPTFTRRIFVQELPDGSQQRVLDALSSWPVFEVRGPTVRQLRSGSSDGLPRATSGGGRHDMPGR